MIRKLIIPIIICMSIYGCAITTSQKKAVDNLGKASESLGMIISNELPTLRKDTIEMNMVSLELRGAVQPDNLDSNFNNETLAVRIDAAKALACYGKLLLSLVRDDQTERIKKNSDELFTNISRFNTSASKIDFNQLGDKYSQLTGRPFFVSEFDTTVFLSINQSIQGLGGIFQKLMLFYYNYKKAKCLKKIVHTYHNEINKICYLMMNDFSTNGKGLIRDYKNTIDILENSVSGIRFINECCQRKIAVRGYYLLLQNETRMNSVAKKVESTLHTLINANNTLARYLENKTLSDLSDIESLTLTIRDLTESIKIISK
ncbi:hypothetical protein MHK_005704 [Candidatus Magnetomorum sp. HK-1]|nr:hypothetical protein MHK_005704 [Candidatus Magnetomorum sp. HK-1]